jgi:hypothetical protein
MRAVTFALAMCAALIAASAFGHGPQIQVTNDGGKIVTRQLFLDGPYYNTLSPTTSVYVMPVLESGGVWYSRPNNAIDPILLVLAFPSGPGLAYGYDLVDGGPQLFEAGSVLSVGFAAGLKKWNGASYLDAGATQLKAFRGSNVNITSPPENLAITSDTGPFDSLSLAAIAANYGADGPEVHASLRFAFLGDGTSPASAVADGVYLLSLQLSSTQNGLAASDPYYFVLHKNAANESVASAVNALGFAASQVQWLGVPEPGTLTMLMVGLLIVNGWLFGRRR